MKRRFKDGEHLLRLAAVFAASVVLYGAARAVLVPRDFGTYGHYRAGAITDAAARTPLYAGRARCTECHDDVVATAAPAGHRKVACESCHGALLKHSDDPAIEPARADGLRLCLRCHEANTGKPAGQPSVVAKEHSDEDTCVSCHKPHDPRTDQG